MPKSPRNVYVGIIHHKYGEDVFVGWTEAEVRDKLYEYVDSWWDDFADEDEDGNPVPIPEDREEAISAYFELSGEYEYWELRQDYLLV